MKQLYISRPGLNHSIVIFAVYFYGFIPHCRFYRKSTLKKLRG